MSMEALKAVASAEGAMLALTHKLCGYTIVTGFESLAQKIDSLAPADDSDHELRKSLRLAATYVLSELNKFESKDN